METSAFYSSCFCLSNRVGHDQIIYCTVVIYPNNFKCHGTIFAFFLLKKTHYFLERTHQILTPSNVSAARCRLLVPIRAVLVLWSRRYWRTVNQPEMTGLHTPADGHQGCSCAAVFLGFFALFCFCLFLFCFVFLVFFWCVCVGGGGGGGGGSILFRISNLVETGNKAVGCREHQIMAGSQHWSSILSWSGLYPPLQMQFCAALQSMINPSLTIYLMYARHVLSIAVGVSIVVV